MTSAAMTQKNRSSLHTISDIKNDTVQLRLSVRVGRCLNLFPAKEQGAALHDIRRAFRDLPGRDLQRSSDPRLIQLRNTSDEEVDAGSEAVLQSSTENCLHEVPLDNAPGLIYNGIV